MKVVVTESGSPLDVGTELTVEEIPQWLVNKCKVVPESTFEVATPPKAKQNEDTEPEEETEPTPKRRGRKPNTKPAE